MKYPNKEQQDKQAKFLELLPEEEREEHARLFRFGNASVAYHLRAEGMEPTEIDFGEWLEGLTEPIRSDMEKRGFEDCKGIISFTRYVMEKNDIGMDQWMENNLSQDDYKEYQKLIENSKKLDL